MTVGDGLAVAQLRRGVLEFCVLAVLERERTYGFELASRLTEQGGIVASEGTIYPLLSRLRKAGMVASLWEESASGPPRRYYSATPAGITALRSFEKEWARFKDSVDAVLQGAGE